jgi:hypothetical protein
MKLKQKNRRKINGRNKREDPKYISVSGMKQGHHYRPCSCHRRTWKRHKEPYTCTLDNKQSHKCLCRNPKDHQKPLQTS